MAVLSKIRERSVFLIIIIALALFSFVLSGIFDANSPLFNKNVNDIGGVDGDPITREEFAQEVDLIRARSNGRSNEMQNVDIAWNNLVLTKLYKSQLEKSGVIVGEKDIWDAIVSQVQLQNSPMFQNEAGLFDEEKLKEYVATLKENATNSDEDKMAWLSWLNYEKNIKSSIEQNTYNSLINAGLNSTTKEAERDYFYKNTNVDIDYVYVPYTSIADSLISISNDDIKNYIKEHPKQFTSEPSRDIQFVHFTVQPSVEDENDIKAELGGLLNNKEEYSSAAKANVTVTGFSETDNLADFFGTNSSDLPLDNNYYTRAGISKILADTLFNKPVGTVYGPYKEKGFYKISKVTAVKQLPDSVKASHILIPFVGAATADVSTVRTSEEAKVFADSISNLVRTDKTKFDQLARDISVDRSSAENGGDLGWFAYTTMIPEFRDYVFENKVGDVGVVKTQFGYHIIRIDGQKNPQSSVQIATFGKKIIPSEKTESELFEKAESFTSDLTSGKDIKDLAKGNNYFVMPVQNLKQLDHNVSSLGSQRQIVRWLFEDGTKENDVKRFDIDNGYVVVKVDEVNEKGSYSSVDIQNVRSILINKKKIEMISERSKGSLEEIAKQNNTTVKSTMALSPASPVLSGDGRFEIAAGAVSGMEPNKLSGPIKDQTGVIFARIVKKTLPTVLNNYLSNKKAIERSLKTRNVEVYNAIKKNAEIEDNRAVFY